jgi:hypothetical protein
MTLKTSKLSENGNTFGYRIAVHFSKRTYEIFLVQFWPFIEISRFL